MEVKASYVEIFWDSAFDMKFKLEPVITPNKGDNTQYHSFRRVTTV